MKKVKNMKTMICAAAAVCASVVFAASESFEGVSEGALPASGWQGDGAVEAGEAVAPACGAPIAGDHTKVLGIDGEVVCTDNGTAAATGQMDFLLKVDEASDPLTTDDMDNVKVAVAAGEMITEDSVGLMAYCKNKAGAVAWFEIGAITTSEWHRVTLKFDYMNDLCQISVDGIPVVSDKGYLDPEDKTNDSANGAWYGFATAVGVNSSVAQTSFLGSAWIDDVVVTSGTASAPAFTGASSVTIAGMSNCPVPYSKLNEWGVDEITINTAKLGESGMTVGDRLACGLDPTSPEKFNATDMALEENGTTKITFPGSVVAKNGVLPSYTIKVYSGDTDITENFEQPDDATATETDGLVEKTITPKANYSVPPVLKFKIEATATAAP